MDSPAPPAPLLWFRHGRPIPCDTFEGFRYFYASVHGSTGVPVDVDLQSNQPSNDVEYYGPFILIGAAAIAFDLALICAGNNQPELGNFRALANSVALALEGNLPLESDRKRLKIMYASFLTEAVLEQTIHLKRQSQETFQYNWGRLEQAIGNDVPNFRDEHLPHLIRTYDHLFRNCSTNDLWKNFFDNVLGNEMPPPFHNFRTEYALYVATELENQLQHGIPSSDDVSLINMLIQVLARNYFRQFGSRIQEEPDLRLVCRYGGHLIDAIAVSMIEARNVIQVGENCRFYLAITQHPPHVVLDGVMGTPFLEPLLEALREVRHDYNNRNNSVHFIWDPLVRFVDHQIRAPFMGEGNFLSTQAPPEGEDEEYDGQDGEYDGEDEEYDGQDGEDEEYDDADADADADAAAAEDIGYYEAHNDGIETEVLEDACAGQDYSSCTCKGTKVTYKLKWGCYGWHHKTKFGNAGEDIVTNYLEDGDCASRIHEQVKQIFPFVTEFASVRKDPKFVAAPMVYHLFPIKKNG